MKAVKTFFSSQRFAVAGASSTPTKFGHKLLLWYLDHDLPVTPINPISTSIDITPLPQSTQKTAKTRPPSLGSIPSPASLGESAPEFSLSIVTPPAATRKVLQEAKEAGVKAVWLQPGSYDDDGLAFARREWPGAAVGGVEAGEDGVRSRGEDGWCVLADGDLALRSVARM